MTIGYGLLSGAACAALVLLGAAAAAADFRYCFADRANRTEFFLSDVFLSDQAMEIVERRYSQALAEDGHVHIGCLCPRADSRADALAARDHAIRHLSATGRTVVPVETRL